WQEATTAADGRFRLGNLAGDEYAVTVTLDDSVTGFTAEPLGVVVRDGEEARCPNLRLVRISRGGWVTGRVTDAGRRPVGGVGIAAERKVVVEKASMALTEGPVTRTAPDGTYRLRLPPGSWRVM